MIDINILYGVLYVFQTLFVEIKRISKRSVSYVNQTICIVYTTSEYRFRKKKGIGRNALLAYRAPRSRRDPTPLRQD